jgi:C-terminal processing protease CtpA/Prc
MTACTGLKEGDRIIEVNDTGVDDLAHQDVVRLVKSIPGSVTLLVVDSDADDYFRSRQLTISSHLPSVKRIVCPDNNPNSESIATAVAAGMIYV